MSEFDRFGSYLQQSIDLKQRLLADEGFNQSVEQAARRCVETLRSGGKIMLAGNGGSAADAQHIAAELVVRLRGSFERPAIAAMALTVDTSILTAAGNDYGYDAIFSRQVEALGREKDLLIGISTSGNSANILKAVEVAKGLGLATVGLCGDGGRLQEMADLIISVPGGATSHVQEMHITIGHFLCGYIEEQLHQDA